MKKPLLFAALSTVVISSWAFYPRVAAESGYMILSLNVPPNGRPTVVTTAQDGQETSLTIATKKPTVSVRSQVVVQLNALRSQGWTVVQMTSTGTYVQDINHPLISPGQAFTETYLLEKK
ncbi:MAG TPA: hypothetical protein VF630_17970 [Hymenobacter sp.]